MNEVYLHRKETVVLTAIQIIDELGIQGLSTREIAAREGISEGTLFKHFKNKNEIIQCVLDNFSKFDFDIMESVKNKKLNFKDSIIYFSNSYVEYYNNYHEITSLVNAYEIFRWDLKLGERYKGILQARWNFLKELIDNGKKNEEILPEIESEDLADIIIGICDIITLKWRINHYIFPLKKRILSTINMVIDPILKNE
jgi:AcrR family transcriptional regulator